MIATGMRRGRRASRMSWPSFRRARDTGTGTAAARSPIRCDPAGRQVCSLLFSAAPHAHVRTAAPSSHQAGPCSDQTARISGPWGQKLQPAPAPHSAYSALHCTRRLPLFLRLSFFRQTLRLLARVRDPADALYYRQGRILWKACVNIGPCAPEVGGTTVRADCFNVRTRGTQAGTDARNHAPSFT